MTHLPMRSPLYHTGCGCLSGKFPRLSRRAPGLDLYSQFVIAGGPIGIVSDAFSDWRKTFWDNLAITVTLHNINRVVGVTHRDCGAAAVAYGERIVRDFTFETERHTEALRAFRAEIGKRQPKLAVDTGIMSLDGAVTVVG